MLDVIKEEEHNLKTYVEIRSSSDPLMKECQTLVAAWGVDQSTDNWYDKPLHGAWHAETSRVANMQKTYQWLNKAKSNANTEALIMAANEHPCYNNQHLS